MGHPRTGMQVLLKQEALLYFHNVPSSTYSWLLPWQPNALIMSQLASTAKQMQEISHFCMSLRSLRFSYLFYSCLMSLLLSTTKLMIIIATLPHLCPTGQASLFMSHYFNRKHSLEAHQWADLMKHKKTPKNHQNMVRQPRVAGLKQNFLIQQSQLRLVTDSKQRGRLHFFKQRSFTRSFEVSKKTCENFITLL